MEAALNEKLSERIPVRILIDESPNNNSCKYSKIDMYQRDSV
jgi:hypothetical protein